MIINQMKEKGYQPEESNRKIRGYNFLDVVSPDGSKKLIPANEMTVYLRCGIEVSDTDEAERLAKEGRILSFCASEIYAEYYNMSEDELFMFRHWFSKRSSDALENALAKIQCVFADSFGEFDENFDGDKLHNVEEINGYTIGQTDEGLWVCEFSPVPDGSVVNRIKFTQKPTIQQIYDAFSILKIKQRLMYNKFEEEFTCPACGKTYFWADLDEDVIKAYGIIDRGYCKCVDAKRRTLTREEVIKSIKDNMQYQIEFFDLMGIGDSKSDLKKTFYDDLDSDLGRGSIDEQEYKELCMYADSILGGAAPEGK